MRTSCIAGVAILLAGLVPTPAHAWLRVRYEAAVVVERSEVIVVARLKRDSITYVPHKRKPSEGRSWEHHAVLIVAEVLKGNLKSKEIPIIIHYGLTPVIGGYVKRDRFMHDYRIPGKDYPKDVIEIFDTACGCPSFSPCLTNAGKDNLWFLRRRSGTYGRKPGTGNFGIVDPQDVQPLSLKDYFLTYLSKDPEKAVKEYVAKHPKLARSAETYLDHLEIERILKIADQKTRVERLLPYYAKRHWWNSRSEAKEGIIACGEIAGPYLHKLFDDPTHRRMRQDVMDAWGELRYEGCVDLLVDLLKTHDEFWGTQELKQGWWYDNGSSETTRKRREVYREVFHAVVALEQIGDPRAREAIEITKRRWEAIDFSTPQIVEWCDRALKAFAKAPKPTVR